MLRILLVLLVALAAAPGHAASRFWCGERYLDPAGRPFDARHLSVARRGYLYAVGAALALQKQDRESLAHRFALPERLREIDRPPRDPSGFEAAAYEVLDAPGGTPVEILIAYAGSNDETDWRDTNFGTSRRQYVLARRYLARIALRPAYRDLRVVVAGFSLGGALAVHVTKHAETRKLVHESWAFNPSPKTWVGPERDARIWMAASTRDGLGLLRTVSHYTRLLPGVSEIGAPSAQRADGYYLLDANPVVSHYRWVLTRNLLQAADLALRIEQPATDDTEPMRILRAAHFQACRPRRSVSP
ncbi:MAG: hypothetical protein REI09_03595 [Candidatus Dactylopiibacterium sp.]|nr:hypothetical protein [Candidatus Dactylopiibacterium sp.]